jgi:hypothetical protein
LVLVHAFLTVFLVVADELGGDAFPLGTPELARRARTPGVCTCNVNKKEMLLIKLESWRTKWDFHVRQTRPTACREIDLSGAPTTYIYVRTI